MIRAIFRMLFWFIYDLGMIVIIAVCLIVGALTGEQAFEGIAIAAGVLATLGLYKIISTKTQ